jgi:hypothetical protein
MSAEAARQRATAALREVYRAEAYSIRMEGYGTAEPSPTIACV